MRDSFCSGRCWEKVMSEEYKYLVHILKAFVNNEAPEFNEEVDWSKLLYIAHIHSVDGILAYMAKQFGICTCEELDAHMRDICLKNIALYNKRAALMDLLVEKMNEAHIEHVLFKGYIIKNYYPVPELRSYGDIDFVIRQQDRKKVHQMMLDNGFKVKTDWEPVYSYLKGIEYYEIHTDIMEVNVSDKADYIGYFKDMWKHIVPIDGCTYQFSPDYHFIYLLTHIAKHIYGSGAGIRMYMDIALFIKKHEKNADWEFIREELLKLELYDFSCVVFASVERWFGIKTPYDNINIDDELLAEFELFTLEAGTYGYVNRENGVNTLRKSSDDKKEASRLVVVFQRLFPTASDIEKRYTYLQGRHWLLPVAWVHRLYITRAKWQGNVQEAHSILKADSEQVTELKKFYRDIGL